MSERQPNATDYSEAAALLRSYADQEAKDLSEEPFHAGGFVTADRIKRLRAAADALDALRSETREPDAWMVRATREDVTRVAFVRKPEAEQDAFEWRINGATTEVLPLYLAAPVSAIEQPNLRTALQGLVNAEEMFTRDTGIKLDDFITDALKVAKQALAQNPAAAWPFPKGRSDAAR